MSFSTTLRTIALAPELVDTLFPALLEEHGEPLPDGDQEIVTIGAHWDDSEHTRNRAANYEGGTITGIPLTDTRLAFRALWQSDLETQFLTSGLLGVEELTDAQLHALLPPPPEFP